MCKSVRGAAFFGSSLHLALSFVFLFWFIFDTLISEINIALWKCDPPEQKFRDIDPLAHYTNIFFKLIYFVTLFITGIYIFRGVERERPQLIKFAALAFIIAQVIGVILFSVFFSIQWNAEPDPILPAPEAASLVSADDSQPTGNCCRNAMTNGVADVQIPINVTPVTSPSESVLPAPELQTTTTTTPLPPIVAVAPVPIPESDSDGENATMTPTTTTTTPAPPPAPPSPPNMNQYPEPRRRLPHNQLVSLVLQMCFAVANGLGSVAYVIVLALYMLKL